MSAFFVFVKKRKTEEQFFRLFFNGDQYGIRTRECRLERAMC